ncbi:hypothetical protein [Streptomyces sp. NPDC093600]|uniref:hypothetical protein n=1 Tax=Streptomyces sp. NPDC093600 TaxID=3366047 RepID=UPI0037FDBA20
MIRHTVRALCAASLVIAPLALSTPAHAATVCTVNGLSSPDGNVTGTAGNDYIECASVDSGDTVNGLGGADMIVLTGPVGGTVSAGDGRDYVHVTEDGTVSGTVGAGADGDYVEVEGSIAPGAKVYGDAGNDYLRILANFGVVQAGTDSSRVLAKGGVVDAGTGFDLCRVVGDTPSNCEL